MRAGALVVVVVAATLAGCQRRQDDERPGIGSGSEWHDAAALDPVLADASPCISDCVRRDQARAVGADVILAGCMTECGVDVQGARAELEDRELRVPPGALADLPRCARFLKLMARRIPCATFEPEPVRRVDRARLELVKQLRARGLPADTRDRLELQCESDARVVEELARNSNCLRPP